MLPFCTAPFAAWWLVGDLSEPDDCLIVWSLPVPQGQSALVGVAGPVLACVAAIDWVRSWRQQYDGDPSILFALAGASGVLAAVVVRVDTARYADANIGAGMLSMAAPWAGLLLLLPVWSLIEMITGALVEAKENVADIDGT